MSHDRLPHPYDKPTVPDQTSVPASAIVLESVVTMGGLNEALAQKIAKAKAMLKKQRAELDAIQEQKKEAERLVAFEEQEKTNLLKQVKTDLKEIVETLIKACEDHKYMKLTDAEKDTIRAVTPLQLSEHNKINELFKIIRYFADLTTYRAFGKLHTELRSLSAQIEDSGTDVRSKLFSWLKANYSAHDFSLLLQNLEIPEDEIPAAIKTYQNFLRPLKLTTQKELTSLKNLLETKVTPKIKKLSNDLEKVKYAQSINDQLKLKHELVEKNLKNLGILESNPQRKKQVFEASALIELAITMAKRTEAICALFCWIQQLKNKFDTFKQSPPPDAIALRTLQTEMTALSDSVLQCKVKEAEYAEHLHQKEHTHGPELQWMEQVSGVLQSDMEGLVKTYQAPGSASVLSESQSQAPKPEPQPPRPEPVPEPVPEPGTHKPRSCCNFLLQLMASKAVRNLALVLIVAGAIGIVVGGLSLGGVGGVAAAFGLSILGAKIVTATSTACFVLGAATFFGSLKAKGMEPSEPVLSDNQHRLAIIASM